MVPVLGSWFQYVVFCSFTQNKSKYLTFSLWFIPQSDFTDIDPSSENVLMVSIPLLKLLDQVNLEGEAEVNRDNFRLLPVLKKKSYMIFNYTIQICLMLVAKSLIDFLKLIEYSSNDIDPRTSKQQFTVRTSNVDQWSQKSAKFLFVQL